MRAKTRVVVWNEYRQEREEERIARVYPEGIHGQLAAILREDPTLEASTATLDAPEHGLPGSAAELGRFLGPREVPRWPRHAGHRRPWLP